MNLTTAADEPRAGANARAKGGTAPAARQRIRGSVLLLLLILGLAGGVITAAMRHTSPTFDEIVFVAGGVRGFNTGQFDLAPDHPPLMQYVYGFPVWLAGADLPDESHVSAELRALPGYRYMYSALFYFGGANDPERIAFLGRLPAVLMALALVLLVFLFVRSRWGDGPALLAALLVAFLPDVLAHGGIAYNDVPVTLTLFAGAWAIDSALRSGTAARALLAGALAGLAVSVKISAGILLPLAVVLAILEGMRRHIRPVADEAALRDWLLRLPLVALAAALAAYAVLVTVYRGDLLLSEFFYGLTFRYEHMSGGHGATAFLLGRTSATGWWYFFPVAFLFKTSAGLHFLILTAVAGLGWKLTRDPGHALASHLRWPVAAVLLFGGVLLWSSLNIGFRYAMPVLPMLCVIAAAGIAHVWLHASRFVRAAIVLAALWAPLYTVSWFPHFLPFISEYGPARDRGHEVLVDSSLDWGQGLLALRDFVGTTGSRIYLSYFGSAWPAAYGIEYEPLHSFFPLPAGSGSGERPPRYMVVSATNLRGVYFAGDPFAPYREVQPDTVLAHTLYVFRMDEETD
jgi:4-amino-4-deoxy-L-arabinose transferase-like glycosyltransferase